MISHHSLAVALRILGLLLRFVAGGTSLAARCRCCCCCCSLALALGPSLVAAGAVLSKRSNSRRHGRARAACSSSCSCCGRLSAAGSSCCLLPPHPLNRCRPAGQSRRHPLQLLHHPRHPHWLPLQQQHQHRCQTSSG
ncbi:hypothetical protein COO60DRAFT_28775 [Scenedesmus sp. NREL 46B-D3]|nr:hypothetical protein COO60DRAFT_28775 [Scenedesmus sp. NREL 46B-D3]